ncbi:MAG: T9SS type A sorting domain-containing protein [Bacteroidetes bacterium]|jgi:hypothetical protein|nr:T9SS type A sorting domain-containing protein [Bacteroidota bacterium]
MQRFLTLILLGSLVVGTAQAQSGLVLQESTIGGAGGTVSSSSYQLTAAAGQVSPAGTQEGSTLTLYSGYPSPDLGFVALLVRLTQELSDALPAGEAASIQDVEVVNRAAEVETVTLFYRTGDETEFASAPLTPDQGVYQGAIPAEAVTERGVAFYVEAQDAQGNTARAPANGISSFPVRVDGEGIAKSNAQPTGTSESAYRLISVPMQPDAAGPGDVLEDNLGEYNNTEWRFFEGARQDGATPPEFGNTAAMTPGQAFWLIVRGASDPIDTGAGEVLRIDTPFEVDLVEGWNYVANPFNYPLPVANLQRESGDPVALYRYTGSWEAVTDANATLPPFSGFAIESSSDDVLAFDPVLPAAAGSAQSKLLAAEAGSAWSWSIGIAGRSGPSADRHNVAAVAAEAEDGVDAMDWPEPPAPGRGLSVTFRPEGASGPTGYLVDVRNEPARGVAWPFTVHTTRRDPVTLSFDGLAQVPESFEVWLLDEYNKASQNLRTTPRYTLDDVNTQRERSMRLIVGQHAYVQQELEAAGALPATYALADVYPNPTRGGSTIRYGLPKKQPVTIEVYNTLGQRVATLMQDRPMEPGFHTIQWRGTTGSGTPVASGVYFVRMRAGDFTASKKIVRVN